MSEQIKRKINNQSGAAMLISVVFFLFISLAIISGLVAPTVREFQTSSINLNSKKSYFLAESGIEDAIYRTMNNLAISENETINLGGNSTITTIASVGNNEKQIDSISNVSSYERKVSTSLKTGNGVIFKYGTQSGQGGITFGNNAGLYGSLYSNGDIVGSNGAFITGDAYTANSPATSADQTNGATGVPPDSINFGATNSTQDFAQSFRIESDGFLNKVQFYIKKTGTPSNATVRITTDSNGHPNSSSITTGVLNANLITNNYGWIDVNFSTNPRLMQGVTYWMVIDGSTSSTKYYNIAANTNYATGVAKIGQYSGSWNNTSPSGLDGYFNVFLGGVTGTISNMDIGTSGVGNAYAHTITSSDVTGNIYCQNGSGNNKTCDTSKEDPTQADLPISDALIEKWKTDAEVGGVYNGDYWVILWFNSNLGPKKIDGDLIVYGTLTLTDTVYVTGNIYLYGKVKLASSYGNTTGVLMADGNITTYNNTVFQDSGTAGSYIMLLSNSNCDRLVPGNPCYGNHNAIDVGNNSSLIIANAQKGAIEFSNNSGVKEVVANRIYLANNSTITYGSGIMNVNFTSGPSGSWVVDSWEESQ